MSGRGNNTTPSMNMEAMNTNVSTDIDANLYELQYRRIVERAIASLGPDIRSESGATTQDTSSNDDSSVSKQGERSPAGAHNGQQGLNQELSLRPEAVTENSVPQLELPPNATPMTGLQTLQHLLQRAEHQDNLAQLQDVRPLHQHQHGGTHAAPRANTGNEVPSLQKRQETNNVSDNSGYPISVAHQARGNLSRPPGLPHQQYPEQPKPNPFTMLQAFTQAATAPPAPTPAPQTSPPDLLGGLQLLIQLLPLLLNNQNNNNINSSAQQQPPQGYPARQQIPPQQQQQQQQGGQDALMQMVTTQLLGQLLEPQKNGYSGSAVESSPNPLNALLRAQQPPPRQQQPESQQQGTGASDLQNLLIQNLLSNSLSSNQAPAPSQDRTPAPAFQAPAPANNAAMKPSMGTPDGEANENHSEAAIKNLMQMASLVMAQPGTQQTQPPGTTTATTFVQPAQAPPMEQQNVPPVSMQSRHNGSIAPVAARPPSSLPCRKRKPRDIDIPSVPVGSVAGASGSPATQGGGAQQHPPSSGGGIPVFMDYDEEALTEYQCLLRKQIELFEATQEDVQASAQGRNNPILLGQVGIRCRYCAALPIKARPRGAVYYSRTIGGIYQVGQNMAKLHFCRTCKTIPEDVRAKLKYLQAVNRRASGGKEYWSEGLRVLGVYEDGDVMRLRSLPSP